MKDYKRMCESLSKRIDVLYEVISDTNRQLEALKATKEDIDAGRLKDQTVKEHADTLSWQWHDDLVGKK